MKKEGREEMKKEGKEEMQKEDWRKEERRVERRLKMNRGWNQELDTAGLELEVKIEERSMMQGNPMRSGGGDGRGTDG
jgi:hypothetical protein